MRWPCLLLPSALGLGLGLGCDPGFGDYPDARRDGAAVDARPPIDTPPADASCVPLVNDLPPSGGHHFPGTGCTYGCHDDLNGPAFHFGGTVYVNYGGQLPRPGATVHVDDFAGRRYEVTVQDNGNFFLPLTAGPVDFPLKTWVSACPQVTVMEMLVPRPGNCNDTSAACHPTNFRIRLPLPM